MPSIRQVGQQDGRMTRDAMREVSPVFESQLLVKQWTGTTGGTPTHGIAPTDTFNLIPTRGNVSGLTAQEIFYSASVYQAGDLNVELRIQVFGAIAVTGQDGQTAPRKSDQVVYRGRTYYFVGHIDRLEMNGRQYWKGVMRPLGS